MSAVHRPEYDGVPAVEPNAAPDDHWSESRLSRLLPESYMPPPMGGERSPRTRFLAGVLVVLFLAATAAGVGLAYGLYS